MYAGLGWILFREKADLHPDLVFSVDYLGSCVCAHIFVYPPRYVCVCACVVRIAVVPCHSTKLNQINTNHSIQNVCLNI